MHASLSRVVRTMWSMWSIMTWLRQVLLYRWASSRCFAAMGKAMRQQLSSYDEQGDVKTQIYGEKPSGLTVFDRSGYYISYLARPDLPKFAANNRQKGSDAEYRGIMQGMIAGFGTYTVEGNTVTIK